MKQWCLLTALKVDRPPLAAEVDGFYLRRWTGEAYSWIWESGCRTKHRLSRGDERLQRAIAINAVIAWRMMVMTRLGRQGPDRELGLMFTDGELHMLRGSRARLGFAPSDWAMRCIWLPIWVNIKCARMAPNQAISACGTAKRG